MALWAEYDWLLGRPWGPWLYKLPLCYFISLELGIFLLYQTIYIYSHYYVYVYLLLTLPVCRYQPFASRWSKFERFSGSTFLFFMPTYRLPLLYFFSLEMLCTIVLQAINPYHMVALGFSPLFSFDRSPQLWKEASSFVQTSVTANGPISNIVKDKACSEVVSCRRVAVFEGAKRPSL